MPTLDPEVAALAKCAARGHGDLIIEPTEPRVGFIGVTYCNDCGVELGRDRDGQQKLARFHWASDPIA